MSDRAAGVSLPRGSAKAFNSQQRNLSDLSGPCGWRSISRPHKGRRSPLYGFLRDRPIILYGLAPTLICMALGLSWLSGTCFAVAVSRSFCRACQSIAAACSVDPHCDSRESVIWTSRPLKAVIPAGGFPGFINPNPPAIVCVPNQRQLAPCQSTPSDQPTLDQD
jgi:hypothetical protein